MDPNEQPSDGRDVQLPLGHEEASERSNKSEHVLEPYDPTMTRYKRIPLSDEPDYGLCEVCRTIDFASFWSIDDMDANYALAFDGRFGVSVFEFPKEWPSTFESCFFCKMTTYSWTLLTYTPRVKRLEDIVRKVLKVRGGPLFKKRISLVDTEETPGLAFAHLNISAPPTDASASIGTTPDYTWLELRLERLDAGLSPYRVPSEFQINLIDCETLTVVEADTSTSYLALSYVIGPNPNSRPEEDPRLLRILEMPQTIQDAISFTKSLDQRYLWVDRYCITGQGDIRKEQLIPMADIYSSAWATIVCTGSSHDAPIPGVSSARSWGFAASTCGGQISLPISDISTKVSSSRWMTRAWTFQECMLSRRLVFTLEGGIILVDSQHCYLEGSILNKRKAWADCITPVSGSHDQKQTRKSYSRIHDHFRSYTSRKLTYESNALDAFRGYLNRLPYPSFWGVMCLLTTMPTLSAFCKGLVWANNFASRYPTPEEFEEACSSVVAPSWSWIASRPLADQPYLANTTPDRARPMVDIEIVFPETGQTIAFEEFLQKCAIQNIKILPEVSQVLQLSGYVFTFRPLRKLVPRPSFLPIETDFSCKHKALKVDRYVLFDLRVYATLVQHSCCSNRSFEAMVVVEREHPLSPVFDAYAIAIQQQDTGHWCRIGLVQFHIRDWLELPCLSGYSLSESEDKNQEEDSQKRRLAHQNIEAFKAALRALPKKTILLK